MCSYGTEATVQGSQVASIRLMVRLSEIRTKNKVWYHCIIASQECPENMGQVVIEGEHSALEDEEIVRGKAHDGAFENERRACCKIFTDGELEDAGIMFVSVLMHCMGGYRKHGT